MKRFPGQCFFGPVKPQASWQWVGADVARRLADQICVGYFETIDNIPDDSVVFWIKAPGSDGTADQVRSKRLKLLFFPVDCFEDEAHIARHRSFIDAACLICLHAHSLAPYFVDRPIAYVDHYNKYGVLTVDRRPGDTFLWIGTFQYVPFVLSGLLALEKPLPNVLLLTNLESPRARVMAEENAAKAGLDNFSSYLDSGMVEVRQWTETSQRLALLTCQAAFDVKFLADFNQRHKPPTKMQKYLCSGIPCAVNAGVPYLEQLPAIDTLEHFAALSLLGDANRIQACAEELSACLSLDRVAKRYLELALVAADMRAGNCLELSGLRWG